MVVGNSTISLKDLVDHFLTVTRPLQGTTKIRVVERCVADKHREGVVLVASHIENIDVDEVFQQLHRLQLDPVDGIDLAGHQRVETGGGITDINALDLSEVATVVGIPMLFEFRGKRTDARLERHHLVGAGTDAVGDRLGDLACREDADVIVRNKVREIRTAILQNKLNLMVGQFFHFRNVGDNWLCS